MASFQMNVSSSSFQSATNFSWQIGHGWSRSTGSEGAVMYLFFGSAAAREAAKAALVAVEEASISGASSGLSLDLIHS